MVRVKNRYILGELVTDSYKRHLKLPLKERDLREAILQSVEENYGDYGLACIDSGFAIKLYNSATRLFIVRVRRQFHTILATSLSLVTSAGQMKLSIRTLHLSGTISSSFKVLVERDKEKLNELLFRHKISGANEKELSDFVKNCQNRFCKAEADAS